VDAQGLLGAHFFITTASPLCNLRFV